MRKNITTYWGRFVGLLASQDSMGAPIWLVKSLGLVISLVVQVTPRALAPSTHRAVLQVSRRRPWNCPTNSHCKPVASPLKHQSDIAPETKNRSDALVSSCCDEFDISYCRKIGLAVTVIPPSYQSAIIF